MALDFPNSPTNGQTFTSGGSSWTYDGTKWVPTSQSTVWVNKAGDTMTGALNVLAPTAAAHATTKSYVDGKWVQMTQAAYNALGVKDPNVLYIIVG